MHARPRIRVTTPPRGQQRLNKRLLLVGGLLVLIVAGGAFLWWRATKPPLSQSKGPRDRPAAEYVVTEKPTPMRQDLRLPKDYTKLPLGDAPPAVPVPPAPGQPTPPTPPPARPAAPQGRFAQPRPPAPPQGLPPPPPAPAVLVQGQRHQTTVVPAKVPGEPKPARWFGAKPAVQGNLLTAPLPVDKADTEPSKLFPKAVWERPKEPTKVLYADQVVNGLLMQNLNSDAPGTFRIKVTQDVVDRWGLGTVLMPLDTTVMGSMEGQARYGQKRIPAQVEHGHFAGWHGGAVCQEPGRRCHGRGGDTGHRR